jgi:hypothetical protein
MVVFQLRLLQWSPGCQKSLSTKRSARHWSSRTSELAFLTISEHRKTLAGATSPGLQPASRPPLIKTQQEQVLHLPTRELWVLEQRAVEASFLEPENPTDGPRRLEPSSLPPDALRIVPSHVVPGYP